MKKILNISGGVFIFQLPLEPDDIVGGYDIKDLKQSIQMACQDEQQVEPVNVRDNKPWPIDAVSRIHWVNKLCSSFDKIDYSNIHDYHSIEEVIIGCRLNTKQAAIFTIVASLLLKSLLNIARNELLSGGLDDTTMERLGKLRTKLNILPEQMIMFLGGVAGTGKSYVLNALR